jgi:uncharacterized membrane protein (DUF485 family)
MSQHNRPLFADLKAELAGLKAEVFEMAMLRWELARREFQIASAAVQRLCAAVAIAGIAAFVSLPVFTVCLAEWLDGRLGVSRIGWLGIFGLGLLVGAIILSSLAIRRFRRVAAGLRESIDELREDLVWIREKLGGDEPH